MKEITTLNNLINENVKLYLKRYNCIYNKLDLIVVNQETCKKNST